MKPLDAYKNKSAQSKEQKHKALTAKLRASNSIILSENIISQREKHTQSTTNNTGKAPKQPEKKPTNSLDITSKNDAKISSTGNTSSISFHPNRQQLKIAEKTDLGISKVIAVKHTVSTNANQTKDKKLDALSAKISWTQNSRQNQIINTEMLNMEIRKRQPLKEFKTPDIAEEIVPQVKDKRFEWKSFWIQDQKLDKQALNKEIQDRYTMKQFRNLASVPEPFPSPLAKYCAPQHCINKKALELEIFERQSRRVQKRINTVDMNSSNKFLNIQISPNTALRDPPPKIPEIKRSHSARNSAEAKSNLPRKRWENNAYSEIWSTSPKANDSAREEKTNKMDGQNKNGSFKVLSLNKLDQDKEEAPKKTSKPLKDLKNNANEPRDVNKTKENNFHTMHNVNNRKQSIKDKLESGKTTQQTERDDKQSVRPSSCPPLKSGAVNYSSGTKNLYKQGKLQLGSRGTLNYISGSVPPGNNKPPGPMKKEPLKDKDDAVCNKNLKQDHPMLVLNVTLPKIEISTASGNSKETKVISSCSGEFKLWGKLENETVKSPSGSGPIKEKKIPQKPKADTSTMSLGTLGDRHFHKRSNPNYAPEKLEQAKNKTIEESPRKAVFQILPDSESVVIQKAVIDEKKPKEEIRSKSEKKYFYKKQDSEPAEMQTKSPPGATSRAHLSLKNFADPFEDTEVSYVSRQRARYEMPARLRAEIVMIYDKDSSQKIRRDQKFRRFNRKLVANDEPRSIKPSPIFCDLNGRNFIKIKKQFFENGLKPDLQKSRKNISTNSSSTDKKVLNNFSNTPGTKKDEPKKPVEEIGELLIKEVQKVFQKPDNEKGLTLESKTGKSTSPITNTDKAHSKKTDIVQPKNKEDLSKKPSPKDPDTVNTSELGKGKATSEDISNIQRKSKYEIQLKCSKKDDFNLTKADGSFKSHIKEVAKRKKEDSKETTKKRIVAWPHEKQSKNYEIQMKCTKLENLQEDTPNEKIKEGSTLKPTLEAKSDAKPKSENTKSVARSQIKKVQVVEKLDKPEEDQTNKKLTANSDKESPRSEILEKNIKNVEENLIKFGFFKPKTESNVNDVPQKDGELPKETAPAEATEKAKIDQQEAAVLKPSEVEKQQTKSKEVSSSGIKKESTALKSSEVEKQQTMNKEVSTSEIKKESPALKSTEVEKQQATNKQVPSSEIKKESIVLKLNYIENQKTKYNRAAADVQARDPVIQALEDMKTKSKKASTSTLLKKKTKKDEVEEINSAAQYLLEQEKKKRYEEMLKGKKKQKKYEQDAKIVAPSIGNTDWGVEIKSRTPTEETKNDSFDDTLMSKSEYLRWKEQKEKNESFKVDQAVLNHKIKKIANIMADTMKQEEDNQLKHDYDVSLKCSKVTDYSLDDQNLLEVEHKTRAQRLEESIREKNANKIKRNLGKEQDDDHRKGQNLTLTKKLDVAETSKNLNNTKPPKCAKIILPLKKLPKQTFEQSLEEYSSILKKPVGDEIKTVPKEFNAEKNKKSTNKALAKYSHLKISFMTVKRPVKKDEKFLPAVVKKKRYVPRGVSKEDRNKIIQMRYEMLKQLQENFNKDNTANLPPEAVQKTEVVIPYKFDTVNVKQPDKKKKETETIEKPKVQHMKGVISNVRPKNVADLQQLTRSVSGSNKKTGDKDGKIKKKNKDGLFGDGKGGDMGKSKKYSTMAEKSDGCDENGCEGSSTTKNESEKTSSGEAQEECQSQSPSKVECPESQGFDVMEAVPQAFQCPSQELEEERQKNLYYRYHQYSFNDLHSYLHDQRTFVKEKKEKEKEIGEKDSKTAKDCTEK
ncbi:transcriptional regulator ATRX-like [Sitophilus oryzae]|uniref:Transcriptional regulator ATRX-like n=1 Tax=Sitophilus oryzae TaxID=7048 RepID=A0A6J2YLV0_SITOR|nr:transcriptional regulator ATRX-like [Sitophilus oryzae]